MPPTEFHSKSIDDSFVGVSVPGQKPHFIFGTEAHSTRFEKRHLQSEVDMHFDVRLAVQSKTHDTLRNKSTEQSDGRFQSHSD